MKKESGTSQLRSYNEMGEKKIGFCGDASGRRKEMSLEWRIQSLYKWVFIFVVVD